MMRSFLNMYRHGVGFDTSRLLTMGYVLPTRKYTTREMRASISCGAWRSG